MRHLPIRFAAALTALLATGFVGAQTHEPARDPLARYQECITRLAFRYHTIGRQRLASLQDDKAMQQLAADYRKPQAEAEYARYTIASILGRSFDSTLFVEPLTTLRLGQQKPADAWLWLQALRVATDHEGELDVQGVAAEAKQTWQRAAAIAAIGGSKRGNVTAAIKPACAAFPKKDGERMLLLGAMTFALWETRARVNDAEYREALTAYIGLLDPKVGLSKLGKLQMARTLQAILKAPAAFEDPASWLQVLARGDVKKTTSQTSAAPSFFGIGGDGERFCYVIDLSDSMGKKVPKEHKGPITGERKKPKNAILDESDLPWHKIDTRWDLAREQLRISLSRLQPDQWFCVVWFGSEAGTLAATKGLVKATRANIDKAMGELDAIKLGEADPVVAPDGRLRGRTNLHGGLRRAFAVHSGGLSMDAAYVDEKALADGCDTVFLLSDGAPSADDFLISDRDYGEEQVVVDVEYGAAAARSPRLDYYGPYIMDEWLVEDVRRMNTFRRIRIHCIGLGEANLSLLRSLAGVGGGETFVVGQQRAPANGGGGGGGLKK